MLYARSCASLRNFLLKTRNSDGGWPYYAGRQSRLEATCWAMLALPDLAPETPVAAWRASNGLLVEPTVGNANLCFNGLAALVVAARVDGGEKVASHIMHALLELKGVQLAVDPVLRLDASLQGWPWTDGTFSWVEPTAWCTLAAKKLGRPEPLTAARVGEAEKLLRDRACEGGGWNFGNSQLFGQNLPAHVPATAAGVLAMQDRRDDPALGAAIQYLRRQAFVEGSTIALGLSWIALAAAGARDDELAAKLSERLEVTEHIGNISSAAMMLYVLDAVDRNRLPVELML